ncbi:glycosyltransferase [Geofilum rubicundum]|uniref:Glycosyltransferase, group 1 family protein n=1 Tax=Geofilum rubicundum JCM 15548 TaxID=1236989 RepID=A0A0E9LZ04_9BACT|nr:glycosyltransferase [Geofilum rubicundum]GAO30523.1 glycosyltransferase, group 1 family protein [Geofilum rubicundum JCM 15548]
MKRKRIIITVSNNLVTDNRVTKLSGYLEDLGWKVLLLGRQWPGGDIPAGRPGVIRRFKLLFNKGPLFYAALNFRLFIYLLGQKADKLVAVDLDTLAAACLAGKLKRIPVVFDSHEYFPEVPEIRHKTFVKWFWLRLESFLVPMVDEGMTVSQGIVEIYRKKYGRNFKLIRNVPNTPVHVMEIRPVSEQAVVYYQGALNVGRGLKESVRALLFLPNYRMVIAGSGDEETELHDLVKVLGLEDRVRFTGQLPFEALAAEAAQAHVGLCILENMGLNYYHSLPNRIFDYPALGLPVIATSFPDMAEIVNQYQTGLLVSSLDPEEIAKAIQKACEDAPLRDKWKHSLKEAVDKLNWEKECGGLNEMFG